MIYKGEFEVSDNIIYIPDIYLNKLNLGVVATGENLNDILKNCYTGNDFLKECNGYKNIAKALFVLLIGSIQTSKISLIVMMKKNFTMNLEFILMNLGND